MTIAEIARNEGITERSAQRYVTVGYKGHLLPATRSRRAYAIALDDYRAWRIACGFNEPAPQPEARRDISEMSPAVQPQVSAPVEPPTPSSPTYPPWPMAADPNGELTNGPTEHSRNWPHPKSCEAHAAEQLRKQQRGIPDEE